MKSISTETWEQLNKLSRDGSWLEGLLNGTERQVAALEAIGHSAEAKAIPEFLYLLVTGKGEVWRAAAEAADKLVATLEPAEYVALDQMVRSAGSCVYGDYSLWRNTKPEDLKRFAETEFSVSLLGLASSHPSGYVREAAVKELALQNSGNVIPFLLLRLNDWVGSIRQLAFQALRERLNPFYAKHLLNNWPLLIHLKECGRADVGIIGTVTALLKTEACIEAVQWGMNSRNRIVRRASFRLMAESAASSRLDILSQLTHDTDPGMRTWAAHHLLPDIHDSELPEVVKPMLKDRYMPVRSQALALLAQRRPDVVREALLAGLLDPHVSVRELARHFMAKESGFDNRQFYQNALREEKTENVYAAICGVGETGTPDDCEMILDFLNHKEPKLRRAAVYALGRLNGEKYQMRIFTMLSDPQARVVKQAMKALLPKARLLPMQWIKDLPETDDRRVVRQAGLMLLLKRGKWERLPLLLQFCADEDPVIVSQALNAWRDWFVNYNKSFAEPTRDDFENITRALQRYGGKLSSESVREMENCLKIYFR
jgi:HEAT repeat protein